MYTPVITIIIVTKGTSIISITKRTGSLHDNDNTIIIAATNTTAKAVSVDIIASVLRPRRSNTDDIDSSRIRMPPTMATPICASCAVRLNPNVHLLILRVKIVEVGTCAAMAKKINTAPIIVELTTSN